MEDLRSIVNPEPKKRTVDELAQQVQQYSPQEQSAMKKIYKRAYEKELELDSLKKNRGKDLTGYMMIGDFFNPKANLQAKYQAMRAPGGQAIAQGEKELSGLQKQMLQAEKQKAATEYQRGLVAASLAKAAPESSGLKEENKAMGKNIRELEADQATAHGAISSLRKVYNRLGKSDEIGSESFPGMRNLLAISPWATESKLKRDIERRVHEQTIKTLKSTLGAQFTEKEGERIMRLSYDPKATDAQNQAALQRTIGIMETAAKQKDMARQWYINNGRSMAGFKGLSPKQIEESVSSKFDEIEGIGASGGRLPEEDELDSVNKELGL